MPSAFRFAKKGELCAIGMENSSARRNEWPKAERNNPSISVFALRRRIQMGLNEMPVIGEPGYTGMGS